MDDPLRPPRKVEVRTARPRPKAQGRGGSATGRIEVRPGRATQPRAVEAATDEPVVRRPKRAGRRPVRPDPGPDPGRVVKRPARAGRGPRMEPEPAAGRVEVHHDEAEHAEGEPGAPIPLPALPDRSLVDVRIDSDSVWTPEEMRRSRRKRPTAGRKASKR